MKRIIIVFIIVGILFIAGGVTLSFFPNGFDQTNDDTESVTMTQEEIDEIYNRERNTSPDISKKHCLGALCIKSMEITYDKDSFGVISATVVNQSDAVIPEGNIDFVFTLSDGQVRLKFQYLEIPPSKEVPLELQFSNSEIVSAIDYNIE